MGNFWSTPTVKRTYGWKRDSSREGDLYHNFSIHSNQDQIKKVDLSPFCPPVYDQGHLGSCTANAIGAAYEIDQIKQGEKEPFVPSRLFIYYLERAMEGHVDEDSGAEIKDGIQCIHDTGVCPETDWPYDITKFTEKPPQKCYDLAKEHQSIEYKRVDQTLDQMKQCLIEGFPFVFGFTVYESFESEEVAKTGIVPMPKAGEKVLGGHAVVCIGFDDDAQQFLIMNSWSALWGQKGFCVFPYNYLSDTTLASDLWTVRKVRDDDGFTPVKNMNSPIVKLTLDNPFDILSGNTTGWNYNSKNRRNRNKRKRS